MEGFAAPADPPAAAAAAMGSIRRQETLGARPPPAARAPGRSRRTQSMQPLESERVLLATEEGEADGRRGRRRRRRYMMV